MKKGLYIYFLIPVFMIGGLVFALVNGTASQGGDFIEVISVGQGDSTLVKSGGRAMLIDVGPNRNGVDSGAKYIVPHMRALGITKLDWILLSHPDADHVGGLGSVMQAYPEAKVIVPICFENDSKMIEALKKGGVSASDAIWTAGEDGNLGNFKVNVRCPVWNPATDDNLGCMFVKVSDGPQCAFTTSGDAPMEVEWQMIPILDWRAQILHLGHHGSKFSTSPEWLKAVNPEITIASCGYHNEYHHPAPSTVRRVTDFGTKFYRTDLDGDLLFKVENHQFAKTN